jgi:Undecaprenyl-phosphate galactose phosphotransferase WbaP
MQTTYESASKVERLAGSVRELPKIVTAPYSRAVMTAWLLLADLTALLLAGALSLQIRRWAGAELALDTYLELIPTLALFIVGYLLVGLYPAIGVNPVQELRRLTQTSSAIMVGLATILFLTQTGLHYSRLVFLFFWLFALVLVPLIRMLARKLGVIHHFWGEPVALIGFGRQGQQIYQFLQHNAAYGIRPVVVVNGSDVETDGSEILEISASQLTIDRTLLRRAGIRTAIFAPMEVSGDLRNALMDEQGFGLERLILVSSLSWLGDAAVVPRDLGGILGLEVERNLLHLRQQLLKKAMDILCMLLIGFIGFPILIFCAILVRLDSPGPTFYKHRRVGKGGKLLWVWKFRTMVDNAEAILQEYLDARPELKKEWQDKHKLKDDPRITQVGKLLRKTSLDELPQLINVIRGEMSLVGPRPIVEEEVSYYRQGFELYQQVLPGITGLWQVSGRSDTSYENRVALDEYYIRHWSIWMDLYIMVRTIWVVIRRAGAY